MSAHVIYFGGYKATLIDIKAWIASAIQQKPGVLFEGYPYPDASWDGAKAVDAFTHDKAQDFAAAIKKIESSQRDVIYIVGHSSGCAIANAVDAALKDHTKIVLVALDGYAPSDAQLARPSTQVWIAEGGGGKSLHHDDLLTRIKDYNRKAKVSIKANIYKASADCSTQLALHFSLVNVSASNRLVQHIPDGYKSCQANLSWLG